MVSKSDTDPVNILKGLVEMLKFVKFSNKFRNVVRTIWYKGNDQPERNGEHAFQLSLVAWFICDRFLPHLDLLKVLQYCLAHDLPETYAGDTPAFPDPSGKSDINQNTHADKHEREQAAIQRIDEEWGDTFPSMIKSMLGYEELADEESRFVYALDKFLACLNIHEDGGRTNLKLKVTKEAEQAYKWPRIAKHPELLLFYDAFCKFCKDYPYYYQPTKV